MDDERPPEEPPLTPEEEESRTFRRLQVVKDKETGELPKDGAEILAFRNSAGEPIVVPTAVATEAERALRCYNRHLEGDDWQTIAMEENYPSARACKADVDRYFEEARAMVVEKSAQEMLTTEVARTLKLQKMIWSAASEGSIPAVSEIRQLIMTRAKLAVMLNPDVTGANDTSRTVVIPGSSADYIATLQKAAGNVPADSE